MGGIFCVWKPKGPTSHDIINKIRIKSGEKRVGHAGTLDPLAEGILVVGVGRENTRQLDEVVKKEKEYIAEITLGEESETDDGEGVKTKVAINIPPGINDIERAVKIFVGNIMQIPPKYSAIKVRGKRSYKAARQGQDLKLEPREVLIKFVEVLSYEWPKLLIKVVTGPGVYIRALARDIGRNLNTGGYLSALTRTRVGNYEKKDCKNIE